MNLPVDLEFEDFKIYKIVRFSDNPKTKSYQRSIYNLLDFIGDVGGLLDGLKLIGQFTLVPLTTFNLTSVLLAKLFKVRRDQRRGDNSFASSLSPIWNAAKSDIASREPFSQATCRDTLSSLFSSCHSKSKRRKRIEQGRSRIDKHLDIVRHIRQ